MILDRIENVELYAGLNPLFAKAFDLLKSGLPAQQADGKYIIDGENLYYTIAHYTTKPLSAGKLEAHKRYIDIQVVLKGEEIIGYAPLEYLAVVEPYNNTKDIEFLARPEQITKAILKPGLFCILFPQDAHLPCCQITEPADIMKIVFKVRQI
jgi:biofilm protein TabA